MAANSNTSLTNSIRTNSRWFVKKIARRTVTLASSLRVSSRRGDSGKQCVRVLTYHRFADELKDPFCVSPANFDQQMAMLADEGRAISLEHLLTFLDGKATVPDDACLVTIDDGMLSTLTVALPVLEKYNLPAVAFVSSKLLGLNSPDLPEPYLDCDELKRLISSQHITIGSHAHTHRSMGELPIKDMQEEASMSRNLLSDVTHCDIRSFAYPFGMQKDFNVETDKILQASGYEVAFNSMHGAIKPGMSPFSLPRVKIEGGESLSMFSDISRGGMDAWRMVDNNFWRAQRVRQEIT